MVRAENPDKKIGIMGFSAGASLSARTATRSETPSYIAIDEIDKFGNRAPVADAHLQARIIGTTLLASAAGVSPAQTAAQASIIGRRRSTADTRM